MSREQVATKNGKRSRGMGRLAPWLLIIGGLVLLARPIVTDWIYALQAEQMISEITSIYDDMSDPERIENLEQAQRWNARLRGEDPGIELWEYDLQLTYKSSPASMMAWVDIPSIGTRLPIYHGTDDSVLAAGVGHCDWSSLPVGGASTRCVVTAHSGMTRTRMFDDIRLLGEGDVFVVWSLGEPHAYKVRDIQVILPSEADALHYEVGRDLCSLVTCTPYAVNTHRLVVTGERCEYVPEMGETSGAVPFVNRRTSPLLAGLAIVLMAIVVVVALRRRRRSEEKEPLA